MTAATFTIHFTKTFVGGSLNGVSIREKLIGCDLDVLSTFRRREAEKTVVKPCVGNNKYRIAAVCVSPE